MALKSYQINKKSFVTSNTPSLFFFKLFFFIAYMFTLNHLHNKKKTTKKTYNFCKRVWGKKDMYIYHYWKVLKIKDSNFIT